MNYEAEGPTYSIPISAVTGNNQTLVAAVAGQKIRVLAASIWISAAGNVQLHDGAADKLGGSIPVGTAAPLLLPFCPRGWGDTASGQPLQVDASAGTLNGFLVYQLVT